MLLCKPKSYINVLTEIYLFKSYKNTEIRMSLNYIFSTFENVTFYKREGILENVDYIFTFSVGKSLMIDLPKAFSFLFPLPQIYDIFLLKAIFILFLFIVRYISL